MKTFIILFLISFNAFAQYKVEIFKQGKLTNRGEFETMEEANTWLEQGKKEHWFARPAKKELQCKGESAMGENCKEVEIEPAEPFEVVGPIDISSEKQAEKAKHERKEALKAKYCQGVDLSGVTTIKALKEIVGELIEIQQ